MAAPNVSRWLRRIPLHDLVWLLLFGGLAATTERGDPWVVAMLAALALTQVLETKLAVLSSQRGRIYWNLLKLMLGVILIGYTGNHMYTESGIPIGGIESRYWMVLALPMISAATALGVGGTLVFSLLAAGSYLMFLLPPFFDWRELRLDASSVWSNGISRRQGAHQVAQKLITKDCPLHFMTGVGRPARSLNEKAGRRAGIMGCGHPSSGAPGIGRAGLARRHSLAAMLGSSRHIQPCAGPN